jgi:hypothetical protein
VQGYRSGEQREIRDLGLDKEYRSHIDCRSSYDSSAVASLGLWPLRGDVVHANIATAS